MKKALVIATAAVLAGSALVYSAYAQQPGYGHRHGWATSAADVAAFNDARIAALKAGLALNAEQEKLWPLAESALRDIAKKQLERREQFRAKRAERLERAGPIDPVARLRQGSEFMTERGAELKRLADAVQPLYEKLDEAQKRRFNLLSQHAMRGPMGGHGRGGHGPRWGHHQHEGRGHGMGGYGPRWGSRQEDEHGSRMRMSHDGPMPHMGWSDDDEDQDDSAGTANDSGRL